ncbi:MAG: pantetheine-phosphate adenylyltransferase [Rectinema sp.]
MAKAVFAGTFDPPTLGHLDIVRRSARIFGGLCVLVGDNSVKKGVFSIDERLSLLHTLCAGIEGVTIDRWDGLIAEYARREGYDILVRGVRDMRDIEYERVMASMNARLEEGLETVFIFTDPRYADISSSAVRELAYRGRMPDGIVSEEVCEALEAHFGPLS